MVPVLKRVWCLWGGCRRIGCGLLGLAVAAPLAAQEAAPQAPERPPAGWTLRATTSFSAVAESDFDRAEGVELASRTGSIALDLSRGSPFETSWGGSVEIAATRYDFSAPAGAGMGGLNDLEETGSTVGLGLFVRHPLDRTWMTIARLGVQGGAFGDDGAWLEGWRLSAVAGAQYAFSRTLRLGLVLVGRYDASEQGFLFPFPLIYWELIEDVLILETREGLLLSWRLDGEGAHTLILSTDFAGGFYHAEATVPAAGGAPARRVDAFLEDDGFAAGLSYRWQVTESLYLQPTLGYVFSRELELKSNTEGVDLRASDLGITEGEADGGGFVSLSVGARF